MNLGSIEKITIEVAKSSNKQAFSRNIFTLGWNNKDGSYEKRVVWSNNACRINMHFRR